MIALHLERWQAQLVGSVDVLWQIFDDTNDAVSANDIYELAVLIFIEQQTLIFEMIPGKPLLCIWVDVVQTIPGTSGGEPDITAQLVKSIDHLSRTKEAR